MKVKPEKNDNQWVGQDFPADKKGPQKLSPEKEAAVDDALGLQAISIRLQKEIIYKLKIMAKEEGLGYQPLIRQILTRYVRDKSIGNSGDDNFVVSSRELI